LGLTLPSKHRIIQDNDVIERRLAKRIIIPMVDRLLIAKVFLMTYEETEN
jgi:hypothetical protein